MNAVDASPAKRRRNPGWIPPFLGRVPADVPEQHVHLLGALACAWAIAASLWSGSASLPKTRDYAGTNQRYSAASEPSQFWFIQTLYLAGLVSFGYMAWRERQ